MHSAAAPASKAKASPTKPGAKASPAKTGTERKLNLPAWCPASSTLIKRRELAILQPPSHRERGSNLLLVPKRARRVIHYINLM